jgi:hypothetical protein
VEIHITGCGPVAVVPGPRRPGFLALDEESCP